MKTKLKFLSTIIGLIVMLGVSVSALAANTSKYSFVIPCQYDGYAGEFSSGIAIIQNGGKSGLIDKDGNIITPFEYDYIYNNSLNSKENPVNYFIAVRNGKWGIIDKTGKILIPCQYDSIKDVNAGLAIVGKGKSRPPGGGTIDGQWGLINLLTGKEILPIKYESILPSNDSLLFSVNLANKAGVIDRTGKFIVQFGTYDFIGKFNDGFAVATKNGWWGVINRTGRVVVQFECSEAAVFENGAFYTAKDSKHIIYNNNGKVIAPAGKYNVAYRVAGNLIYVEHDGKVGAIDMTGKEIVPLIYSEVYQAKNGLATVLGNDTSLTSINELAPAFSNEKAAVINQRGELILPLTQYCGIDLNDDGYIYAALPNNKWIIKEYNGNTVFTGEYDSISDINEGYVVVKNNEVYAILNIAGDIFVPFGEFDYITPGISEKKVAVRKDGRYGYINLPEYVTPPDNWAKAEIERAIEAGLIPKDMCRGYQENITRADFCRLAVNLITEITGMDIDAFIDTRGMSGRVSDPIAFNDTNDPVIIEASRLGIIKGVSNNKFDTFGIIKRQDAAVMLQRTAKVLDITEPNGKPDVFDDSDEFSNYAVNAIAFISAMADKESGKRVMNGTGKNNFLPLGTYTRQQAFISVFRLFNAIR